MNKKDPLTFFREADEARRQQFSTGGIVPGGPDDRKTRDKIDNLKDKRGDLVADRNFAANQKQKDRYTRKIERIDNKISKLKNK